MLKQLLLSMVTKNSSNPVDDSIRVQILSIILKIQTGLLLVALVIFSLIKLFTLLQTNLEQYEYAMTFQITEYSTIILICASTIWYIFKSQKNKESPAQNIALPHIPSMSINFVSGMVEGFKLNNQSYYDGEIKRYQIKLPN